MVRISQGNNAWARCEAVLERDNRRLTQACWCLSDYLPTCRAGNVQAAWTLSTCFSASRDPANDVHWSIWDVVCESLDERHQLR